MNKLIEEKYSDYDTKELLGIMGFDFYDGRLVNQWNSRKLIIELNDSEAIDVKKLQEKLNYIQFTLIKDFNKIVEPSGGTGYDKESLVFIDLKIGNMQ